jgi:hypothetical protein
MVPIEVTTKHIAQLLSLRKSSDIASVECWFHLKAQYDERSARHLLL